MNINILILICVAGYKYQQPPLLPQNCIPRQTLLNKIATKLCQAAEAIDRNSLGTSVTITGAAGFGKTTTAVSLCHHPVVMEKFTDGFLLIELGPNATEPSVKLRAVYSLLTDGQCDINVVEQKVKQVTSSYYCNLLVIIDDVWHVEDAEPLVMAFSHCTILLTTRMNNIVQHIPTVYSVSIGPMEQHEAVSLLTKGVINIDQLSGEDQASLNELAQDVHSWPLLLSLIRGQLFHNIKQHNLSYHEAIQSVQSKLHNKGLTAFDKNSIGNVSKMRKYAVEVCINVTLELLTQPLSDRLTSLILWTGIGTSLPTAVLHNVWNIPEQDGKDTSDLLWAYGLLQFTSTSISMLSFGGQHCQVHTIISHFIVETMESFQVISLSPYLSLGVTRVQSVGAALENAFQKSCGIDDPSVLPARDYLAYKLSEIENNYLPCHLQMINMLTIIDPHFVKLILRVVSSPLTMLPSIHPLASIREEIKLLIADCQKCLQDTHKVCRKLNQKYQRSIYEKKYDDLIKMVEDYMKTYPISNTARNAITMLEKVTMLCNSHRLPQLESVINMLTEALLTRTPEYHDITLLLLNFIKKIVVAHQQITNALQTRSTAEIETIHHYLISGEYDEEIEQIKANYDTVLQRIAPGLAQQQNLFQSGTSDLRVLPGIQQLFSKVQ